MKNPNLLSTGCQFHENLENLCTENSIFSDDDDDDDVRVLKFT